MFYIGFCPVCKTGLLGIRVCGHEHALIMCDECESIWLNPDLSGEMYSPEPPDFLCPYGDSTLFEGGHWATKEEIEQKGWWDKVIDEGPPLQ